jgi:dTDP-4-dehydrorhamnose reductase
MRILVTGAAGFLGRALVATLHATGHAVDVADRRVDVRDAAAVRALGRHGHRDAVVHLAAMSRIDGVAADPAAGWQVNVVGTANVAALSRELGAHLVLLSTDSVFDGAAGPYAEGDTPNPINAYGRTKLAAEEAVARAGGASLIVRTSLIYGWSAPGRFVNFAPRVVQALRGGQAVTGYTDMLRSPIYVRDLAHLLRQVLERRTEGLLHLAGTDTVSMARFATAVAVAFGLNTRLVTLAPAPPGDHSRSRALGLRVDRARHELGLALPSLDDGLARMRAAEAAGNPS